MSIVPLAVGFFAIQWNRANFLGKSPEQIAAMGRDKWTEMYYEKVGGSTLDMCNASEKYSIALRNLNDRASTRLPASRQKWLSAIRTLSTQYAESAHKIGRVASGGGTMWQTFDASISADVEDLISASITQKHSNPTNASSLFQANKELDASLSKSELSPEDRQNVAKYRESMRQRELDILSVLAKGDQNDIARFKNYLHHNIEVASGKF